MTKAFVNQHGSHAHTEYSDILKEARFLIARLNDYEYEFIHDSSNEDGARDWYGHVAPSISRLQRLLDGQY